MIELGKKYKTRDGRDVRIYAVDGGGQCPVHGAVLNSDGNWRSWCWTRDGKVVELRTEPADLIEVVPTFKVTGWLNVYRSGPHWVHETRELADSSGNSSGNSSKRIACVPIEMEVKHGEGLNDQQN
jgi:hypothetical protein